LNWPVLSVPGIHGSTRGKEFLLGICGEATGIRAARMLAARGGWLPGEADEMRRRAQ
jgi:hypothetical protein